MFGHSYAQDVENTSTQELDIRANLDFLDLMEREIEMEI